MLVGILGLGSIGQRHARNLMSLGCQVIFHDPGHLGSMPRDQVIKMADAVLICTPTRQHARDLVDVVSSKKHAFVEKPIGFDSPPYIAGIVHGARLGRKDIVIATGFMLRFHRKVMNVKASLKDNYVGKITSASFQVLQKNRKPSYLRDGVIRNWMSHEIDLARHLLGNLHCEGGSVFSEDGQDISARITFASIEHDAPVNIDADYLTHPEKRGFSIVGEQGSFNVDLVQDEEAWNDVYIRELQAFLAAIDGKDSGPLATAYDGIAALDLVMQAREKAGLQDEQEESIQVRAM